MAPKKKPAARGINPPDLPQRALADPIPDGFIADSTTYEDLILADCKLTGGRATRAKLDIMRLTRGLFQETRYHTFRALDTRFDHCDLANATWDQLTTARVEFLDCRMTGFSSGEAKFHDTLFRNCKMNFALFPSSTFASVRFERCDLTDATFHETDLSGVVFDHCDLTNADFSRVKLVGADLRGSNLDGVRINPDDLRGVTIDPDQALLLIRLLGVVVAPPEEA